MLVLEAWALVFFCFFSLWLCRRLVSTTTRAREHLRSEARNQQFKNSLSAPNVALSPPPARPQTKQGVVDELVALGVAAPSDGAVCFFIDGAPPEGEPEEERRRRRPPLIVRKGDGGYGYASTDMAALRHRVREERADRIVYVTDAGQALHFESVFAAAAAAGYLDKPGAPGGASKKPGRPGVIGRRRARARLLAPRAPRLLLAHPKLNPSPNPRIPN